MAIIVKKPNLTPEQAPLYTSTWEKVSLIIGLGNPGKEYQGTRHNIGFMCLDRLAELYEAPWQNKKDLKSHLALIDLSGLRLILLKPQTYVNLSGQAALNTAHFYKLPPSDIYIIHDEIRHPLGTIEVLNTQNNFGHGGLKSIQSLLGEDLQLVRVGIGPKKPSDIALTDFVLAHFAAEEKKRLPKITQEVCSLIGEATEGILKPQKRIIAE